MEQEARQQAQKNTHTNKFYDSWFETCFKFERQGERERERFADATAVVLISRFARDAMGSARQEGHRLNNIWHLMLSSRPHARPDEMSRAESSRSKVKPPNRQLVPGPPLLQQLAAIQFISRSWNMFFSSINVPRLSGVSTKKKTVAPICVTTSRIGAPTKMRSCCFLLLRVR